MTQRVGSEPGTGAVGRARLLYEATAVPVTIVAASLGLDKTAFYRRATAWGWQRRRPRRPASPPSTSIAALVGPGSGTRTDRVATALALERFVAERIAVHEADAAAGRDGDPERTARTVTHYARALGLVRTYLADVEGEQRRDEAEPPPRSLSELRDELRRHLERIWDEERARRRARRDGSHSG